MSEDAPEPTGASVRAHANALGMLALCEILRDKGVLDNSDLWKIRSAMVSIVEHSPMPASHEVNRVRAEFDAAFTALIEARTDNLER